MLSRLDRIIENQETLLAMSATKPDVVESVDDLLPRPAENTEELIELCQKLEDQQFRRTMVT